jgi:outer membrane beta-barrel protein
MVRLLSIIGALFLTFALVSPANVFAEDPIDRELEKYWNAELAVPSLVNARHRLKDKAEVGLLLGVVPNDSYYFPIPLGARFTYHLTEEFSVEGSGSYLLGGKSDLLEFIEGAKSGKNGLLEGVKKPPQLFLLGGVDVVYTPFHGKIGVFSSKLTSFDFGFALGLGTVGVKVDTQPELESDDPDAALRLAARWGAVIRFYVNDYLSVRADYRHFAYKPESDSGWLAPVEFTLSAAFLLN